MLSSEWQLQQIRTSDVDELTIDLPGWTQRYTQLERGQFRGDLMLAHGEGVQVYRERTEGAVLQEGETNSGVLGLAIPLQANGGVYSFGSKLSSVREVMGFFGPRRLNLRTPEQFELLVVSVQRDVLDGFEQSRQVDSRARGRDSPIGTLPDWQRQDLVEATQVLFLPAVDSERLARAKLHLLDCLAEALIRFEPAPRGGKANSCRQTVDQALATVRTWMHERAQTPLNVAALCAELSLPRRTLQYSFELALGISPLQYLKSVRLGGARRSLKQGAVSVFDACLGWGFDHPSAFARDYHTMFGELPSQTLERARAVGPRATENTTLVSPFILQAPIRPDAIRNRWLPSQPSEWHLPPAAADWRAPAVPPPAAR